MKKLIGILILLNIIYTSSAQQGIAVPELSKCDDLVQDFMNTYDIPGATFALAKNGKMVYMRSFGTADQAENELTQPHHLFRIASISKPITSIAIMKLVQENKLALSDKAFGSSGILGSNPYYDTVVTDNRIYDITVQQLLEHTAGWNRDLACSPNPKPPYNFSFSHCDPIAFPLHVTQELGESNLVTERALIKFLLKKDTFVPFLTFSVSIMRIFGQKWHMFLF